MPYIKVNGKKDYPMEWEFVSTKTEHISKEYSKMENSTMTKLCSSYPMVQDIEEMLSIHNSMVLENCSSEVINIRDIG